MMRLRSTLFPSQSARGSVITRSVEGVIKFWNGAAKDLYGWKKEEAVGRVSHDLLKTQFPRPLDEIDSEVAKNGRWQGKLIHATRNGGRIVVESQWILQRNGQQETIVEINTPFIADNVNSDGPMMAGRFLSRPEPLPPESSTNPRINLPKSYLETFLLAAALSVPIAWLLYFFFGRLLISAIYSTELNWIADGLMAGRASTPIESYYYRADRLFWSGTSIFLIAAFAGWLLLRNLQGAIVAAASAFLCSFVLFWVVEKVPPLARTLRLDAVSSYFATRASFVYDEQLVFRERPFNRGSVEEFRGAGYSALYGVDVAPWTVEWRTDQNGFRNSIVPHSVDLVVIGDSYMEHGPTEAETFAGRLKDRLSGLTVVNLGKSGYGPMQYLEVLKRYGSGYKPRYALFAFYEGNDILDIHNYRLWKAGTLKRGEPTYFLRERNLFGRYWFALQATASQLVEVALAGLHSAMGKSPLLTTNANEIHPDVALIDLGGKLEKMVIADSFTRLHEAMHAPENWAALQKVIREFKDVSARQQITPIFVYLPSPSRIYAQFSTHGSGARWLAIREREVAGREEIETAVARLVRATGLDFVSLTPILEQEARNGKFLYFRADPHWNAAGTEIAANHVARYIESKYLNAERAGGAHSKMH